MMTELDPKHLQGDGRPLSSEEKSILSDYNHWIEQGYEFLYDESIKNALDRLLVLHPQNQEILLRKINFLYINLRNSHALELLHTLNTLLNLPSFLVDSAMIDEQIRMHAWRSQLYLKQQASASALPDLTYIIEHVNPVQENSYLFKFYYDALNARSKIFKAQGMLEEELFDLNALLTPPLLNSQKHLCHEPYGNLHGYSRRGLYRRSEIYVAQGNYDDALRDLDALLNEDECDAPAVTLHKEVSELVVRKQILSKIEGAAENRAIPSLKTLAKMTFFRHEVNIDTSEWVASNPMAVRTLLEDVDITPEAIHNMRELMSELLFTEIFVGKTVFDDLAMHEDATDNKKRKHDVISSCMS